MDLQAPQLNLDDMLPRDPRILLGIANYALFSLTSIWLIVNIWYLDAQPPNIDSTIYVVQVVKAGIVEKAIVDALLDLGCGQEVEVAQWVLAEGQEAALSNAQLLELLGVVDAARMSRLWGLQLFISSISLPLRGAWLLRTSRLSILLAATLLLLLALFSLLLLPLLLAQVLEGLLDILLRILNRFRLCFSQASLILLIRLITQQWNPHVSLPVIEPFSTNDMVYLILSLGHEIKFKILKSFLHVCFLFLWRRLSVSIHSILSLAIIISINQSLLVQ